MIKKSTYLEFFPYPTFRLEQENIIEKIELFAREGKNIILVAPNGTGKTIIALSAIIPVAIDKKLKVIYLCRTHAQSDRVIRELQMINKSFPENSRHATYMKLADRELNEGVLVKLRKLAEIAKDNDMTLAQLSLSWALSRPQISSLITGASKASQVTENAAAGDIVLSRDVVTEIEAIMDND
ncbi:hypothetical protein LCGC14_2645470, partial [marine sediment metagenome]